MYTMDISNLLWELIHSFSRTRPPVPNPAARGTTPPPPGSGTAAPSPPARATPFSCSARGVSQTSFRALTVWTARIGRHLCHSLGVWY